MKRLQLASFLRSEAWVEPDPAKSAALEEAVAALEHGRLRGAKPKSKRRGSNVAAAMTNKELADFLRSRVGPENEPVRNAALEEAADALEHRRRRGQKLNPVLQRHADIILVEQYHEIKRRLECVGSKAAATDAFVYLAKERGLGDLESAKVMYYRAVSRSKLKPAD